MIREATTADIPAILGLLGRLTMPDGKPYEMDRAHVAAGLAASIHNPVGLVLVVDLGSVLGVIWGAVTPTIATPDLVASELAWVCLRPGWGRRLARAYEQWAREKGAVRMTLNPALGDARLGRLLSRDGFAPVETTWIKDL